MNRNEIVLILLISFVIFVTNVNFNNKIQQYFFSNESIRCSDCNVILITADALRADHLTPYGYQKNTTPFLNDLSKESWLFLNATSQSGTTEESISSFFTSKFPHTDDVMNLRTSDKTLTEILREKGYYTKAIVSVPHAKSIFGFSKGFENFDDNFDLFRNASEMTSLAVSWLRNNHEKPFFLWLHYKEPHSPYNPPKSYFQAFYEPFVGGIEYHNYTLYGEEINTSNEMIHNLSIAYDGNIRFLDDNLRILFEYLNNSELLNNTLVIITADHGESLGEHFIFDHNNLYFGIIHVPLILKYPNLKSRIINKPVSLVDILPTILDTLHIEFNSTIRGKSLFLNRSDEELQFAEYIDYYTIIVDRWKLMRGHCEKDYCPYERTSGDYEKLFNIKIDPKETNDLKTNNSYIYEKMRNKLDKLLNTSLSLSEIKSNISIIPNEETKKALKELGYVK